MSFYSFKRADDAAKNFATEGVEKATFSRQANGMETLRLVFRDAATDGTRFLDGDQVIFYRDGSIFFTGRAEQAGEQSDAAADTREYLFYGPWVEFENRSFFGFWKNSDDTLVAAPRGFTQIDGAKVTLGEWIRSLTDAVENRALRQGVRAFQTLDFAGQFDVPVSVPIEALGTMTFAEAVLRACKWIPDVCVWFRHYENFPPQIRCDRAHRRMEYTARFGHDYGDAGQWQSWSVEKASGWDIRGVVIVWNGTVETEADGDRSFYTPEAWPSSVQYGDFKTLVFDAAVEPGETAAPTPGLAEITYQSLRQFAWRGSVTWQGECLLDLDPGVRLNITGGRSEWETMLAFVDRVEHDLMEGTTEVSFGPPQALGLDDFRELLRWWRSRTLVPEDALETQTEGSVETFGFGDRASQPIGFSRKVVYFNENGALVAYTVLAKPGGA